MCGRGESNPQGPKPGGFSYLLRLSPPPPGMPARFGVWTIPSPCPEVSSGVRCCPSSLYTFPELAPGLARDSHLTGFPEFGQFYFASFLASTQVGLSPLRLPVPPRPHGDGNDRGSTIEAQGGRCKGRRLKGDRTGQRSIRLSRAYRAIYEIKGDIAAFVSVEDVSKHRY